jgi:hypothetical protein
MVPLRGLNLRIQTIIHEDLFARGDGRSCHQDHSSHHCRSVHKSYKGCNLKRNSTDLVSQLELEDEHRCWECIVEDVWETHRSPTGHQGNQMSTSIRNKIKSMLRLDQRGEEEKKTTCSTLGGVFLGGWLII